MCVSNEPMRDYAGFGYASLDLVMYPMNLCGIMRDFGYVSLGLVMFRWVWLCFVGFGYVSIVFVVSVMLL